MKTKLSILLILISSLGSAQDTIKKDSLIALLKGADNDTSKVRLLYSISKLFQNVNTDSTLFYAEQAQTFNSTLSIKADPVLMANINLMLGRNYNELGNFNKGLSHFLLADEYAVKSKNVKTIGTTQVHIGQYYQHHEMHDKAIPYLNRAIKLFIETSDSSKLMEAIAELGITQKEMHLFEDAEKNLTTALNYALLHNKIPMQHYTLGQLALMRSLQGRHKEAIEFIEKGYSNSVQLNELADYYWMLGNEYLHLKDYEKALLNYEKGLPIALENNVAQVTADFYDMMSEACAGLGNFDQAYQYSRSSMQMKDTIYDLARQDEMIQMQEQYESDKKDKEIALLNKDKQLKAEEASHQKLIKNIFVAGLIIALLFVFVLLNRYKIKQRTAIQLEEKNIQVEKARARAEQSEKYKSQFLANMSHEIRTPMNAVIGMSYLMEETRLDEKQRRYINAIKNSSENLLVIINDVLDLSKLEAGRMELEKIPFKLDEVLDTVYNTLRYKAEEKGLSLTVHSDKNVCNFLLGDPLRLTQVLLNLTSNAIKFTEGGSVKIEVVNSVTPDKKNCSLEFRVIDTGLGIATEKQQSIFEAFKQESEGTSRKYGGTGLGLSISQQIIQLHGSTINLESTLGQGSKFSFTISYDVTSASAFENKITATENFDFLKGTKILLAEDNEYNQEVAVQSLLRYVPDLTIDIANDGKEALQYFEKTIYDIILMDVQMPGMDGYEATKRIRESGNEKSNIPIIALTASATREEINLGYKAGMNAYVAKPFKPMQLLLKIAELIKSDTFDAVKSTSSKLTILEEITGGNKEQMTLMLDRFRKESQIHFANLEQAIEQGNIKEVKSIIHIFHPQATMVGLNDLSETLQQIGSNINEKETDQLIHLLNKAKEQYQNATFLS